METTEKRKYKVIVKNSLNEIEAMHTFDLFENAVICFAEFHKRYSYYYRIIIEAIQI